MDDGGQQSGAGRDVPARGWIPLIGGAVVVLVALGAVLVLRRDDATVSAGGGATTTVAATGATTSDGQGDTAALADLLAVVDATEHARSYTLALFEDDGNAGPNGAATSTPPATVVFQAPDRYHVTQPVVGLPGGAAAEEAVEMVFIGGRLWSEDGSGHWTVQDLPEALAATGDAGNFGAFAEVRAARTATRTADGFTFTTAGSTGTATVRDGFLVTVVVVQPDGVLADGRRIPSRTFRVEVSAVDNSGPVEEPPADRTVPASSLPRCADVGSADPVPLCVPAR